MKGQQLINSDKWVQDKEAKSCKKCQSSFKKLFRRKHHCRNCGDVFCDNCSNYFLDSRYFQFQEKEKKNRVRLCQGCFVRLHETLRKNGEQIQEQSSFLNEQEQQQARRHSKSFNVINDKLPESTQETQKHLDQFISPQKKYSDQEVSKQSRLDMTMVEDDLIRIKKKYDVKMLEKICELIDHYTKYNRIYDNWHDTMILFVKEAVKDLKEFNLDFGNELRRRSVASFIKIKKIPFINHSATQYMKGITMRKNVAHKKMQTYLKSPKMLLISGILDPEIQTFDSVVRNEKRYIQIALEQIDILQPNIILIEKTININLLNELEKKSITVSINCKIEKLKLIELACGATIQKAFDLFNKTCSPNCIGRCDKLVYTSCNPESIKQNSQLYNSMDNENKQLLEQHLEQKKNRDWTFLFISTPQAKSSISITLSGPRLEELKKAKQCFQQLCQLAYEISLEYEMIILDQKIKQDLCTTQRSPMDNSSMLTSGELHDFAFSLLNDNEQIGEIKLLKIRYHPYVASLIYDVQQQNKDDLENYIKENVQNFNNSKISYFCQLCDINNEQINFYENKEQKQDVSLGKYITDKANYTANNCMNCLTKKINHISIRYGPGAFVKCTIGQKQQDKLQIANQNNSQQKYLNPESFIDPTTKSEAEVQELQQKQAESEIIVTYISCKFCSKQLTKKPFPLERVHLEFSFYRLIQHLIKNSLRLAEERRTSWLSCMYPGEGTDHFQSDKCKHSETERIYEKGDFQVKLYTNLFNIFKIKHFFFNCEDVKIHIKKFDAEEIEKRKEIIMSFLKKLLQNYDPSIFRLSKSSSNLMTKSVNVMSSGWSADKSLKGQDFEEQNKLPIQKISTQPYEDFLELEQDSMQLYCSFSTTQVSEPSQKRGSVMKNSVDSRSTQLSDLKIGFAKQKTSHLQTMENDEQKFQRNNMKHNSQVQQQKSGSNQEQQPVYPNSQLSPLQAAQSPDSPGQEVTQIDEQSEAGDIFDYKEQNKTKSQVSVWPNIACNLDQINSSNNSSLFFYNYIPIYSINDIGLIGAALNNEKYQLLFSQRRFEELWNKIISKVPLCEYQTEIKFIFKEQSKQTTITEVQIRFQKNQQIVQKVSSNNLQLDEEFEGNEDETLQSQIYAESPRKASRSVIVQLYYPIQFECFRMLNGINVKQFIKSIASCSCWDSAGGKSGSTFFKSADNLFIFKAVKESEFFTFDEFAPQYFEHMFETIFTQEVYYEKEQKSGSSTKKQSILNKIYGMFSIKNSKGTTYFIAMENLFFGMSGELIVYDLKGSEAKRWNRKNLKTLLDTNYIIDRNGEPLPLGENDYRYLKTSLDQDSLFLQQVEVVDYSLLLIIDKLNNEIKVSIIDYLQYYNLKKQIENRFKTVINLGTNPTIVNPVEYRERFIKAMDRYFMGIKSSL